MTKTKLLIGLCAVFTACAAPTTSEEEHSDGKADDTSTMGESRGGCELMAPGSPADDMPSMMCRRVVNGETSYLAHIANREGRTSVQFADPIAGNHGSSKDYHLTFRDTGCPQLTRFDEIAHQIYSISFLGRGAVEGQWIAVHHSEMVRETNEAFNTDDELVCELD